MPDLGLQSFNKLYPMMIRKYQDLVVDQNASEKDKINSIIQKLNALGKLSNDVVRDWNTVYNWAMNDGLNTDVSNKLEEMRANGEISQLLQNIYDSLVGSMSNLHTSAKDLLVNAINEVDDLAKANQTAINTNTANIATNTANIATNTTNIASNTSALTQKANQADLKDIVYSITSYTSYKSGLDWYPAIVQAMNDLVAVGGGTLYFPKGTYTFNGTITPPANIRLKGAGKGITKLQLLPNSNKNMVRFVAGVSNIGITELTLDGNGSNNTSGDGLVLDGTGVSTANASVHGWVIEHLFISGCAGNGITSIPPIWMYTLREIEISYCGGHGMYITSSDNSYDTIMIDNCKGNGIYDFNGANNRYHNVKSIFNGNGAGAGNYLNTAGFYFNGSLRSTITNCEAQENYGHGIIIQNAHNLNLVGIVSDANGYQYIAFTGTPVAGDGLQILGSFNINVHNYQATNYKSTQTQNRPVYIDSTCSDIMIDHQQDYNNYTDSVILSNLNVSVKKNWDDLINQFKNGNNTLNNTILNGQFSGTSNWNMVAIASNSTSGGVLTFTANANYSRVSQTVSLTNGHLYYISAKVLTSLNAQNIFFNILKNSSPYPTYGNTGAKGTGSWETLSNFVLMTDVTGNYELGVFDQRASGWDAIQMKEVMLIDVTSIITNTGLSTAKTNKLAKTFDQIVINGGGWFQGVKNLGLDSRVSTLEQSKLNGATASRPTPQYVGQPFFDTTLGKPVYCKQISPTIWVDATGATV